MQLTFYNISSSGIIIAAIALNNLLSIIKNTSLYFLFNRLVAINDASHHFLFPRYSLGKMVSSLKIARLHSLKQVHPALVIYITFYNISSSGIIIAAIALNTQGNTIAEIMEAKSTAEVCILSIKFKS